MKLNDDERIILIRALRKEFNNAPSPGWSKQVIDLAEKIGLNDLAEEMRSDHEDYFNVKL